MNPGIASLLAAIGTTLGAGIAAILVVGVGIRFTLLLVTLGWRYVVHPIAVAIESRRV